MHARTIFIILISVTTTFMMKVLNDLLLRLEDNAGSVVAVASVGKHDGGQWFGGDESGYKQDMGEGK